MNHMEIKHEINKKLVAKGYSTAFDDEGEFTEFGCTLLLVAGMTIALESFVVVWKILEPEENT